MSLEQLPERLADMRPGPELAQVLASVDRSELNGYELVVLLQARNRQLSYEQAELYADMAELAHCPHGDIDSASQRQEWVDGYVSDEIRVELSWTRARAGNELGLALDLVERLPNVWQALSEGRIDLPKAKTFAYGTEHLTGETAREVTDQLLDRAPELTTGQLHARLRRLCMETNPGEAADLYQQGSEDRKVVLSANPDGTANLSGYQLPPDRANAIVARISRIAQGLKTKEDPRGLDQIRADVYLDLLAGNHRRLRYKSADRGVVDIHVNVETLVGLSDSPAEIPGWGPVIADLARQISQQQQDAEWRYTATNAEGDMVAVGTTRRRPTTAQRRQVEAQHRKCIFPGCRTPARRCDLDHRRPWAQGGPTSCCNLAPLCRHDHQLKDHGWKLEVDRQGQHIWTSPHGHTYQARAP